MDTVTRHDRKEDNSLEMSSMALTNGNEKAVQINYLSMFFTRVWKWDCPEFYCLVYNIPSTWRYDIYRYTNVFKPQNLTGVLRACRQILDERQTTFVY